MRDAARQFEQYLDQEMASGRLATGVKLPSERYWTQRFCISRGTVRRVLQAFQARGVITRVMGSGTFVTGQAMRDAPANLAPLQASPAQLLEARLHIEPVMAELIVRNATTHDFRRMDDCLRRSEQAATLQEYERWDEELHALFAAATHNAYFIRVMDLINRSRAEGVWGRLKQNSYTPERQQAYMRQHRAIFEALRERDLAQARALMREHLVVIRNNVFGN